MQLLNVLEAIKLPANQATQYVYKSELNILFVNPEATGGNFYKMLLPYAVLKNTQVIATPLTGWDKYNPIKRFRNEDKRPIGSVQVVWADSIVFPFTNQPLHEFMEMVRTINPNAIFIYHIDFDFINLPKNHPLKDAFPREKIDVVIKNMMSADKVVVTNGKLAAHLITSLQEMGNEISRDKFSAVYIY